jgi:GntR family transcriptional regulator, transcriptional repressor for pyruvate dehydrogenase complex
MPKREIQPIHRRQVSQATIDRLLGMINDGFWAPGDKLPPQRDLAEALDVGMSTLREALQALHSMGILEVRHGDGTYLAENPPQEIYSQMVNVSLAMGDLDLQMLFEARGILETGFAFIAAERATDEQVEELFNILKQERSSMESGNRKEIHQLDLAFHKKIAEIANNPFLRQIVGSLFDALDDVLQVVPQTLEGWHWHFNVATEIRNHEPMRASEAMRTLVNASGARLLPFMSKKLDVDKIK